MARVRKAVIAGVSAAGFLLWGALVNGDQPSTAEGWAALIGGAVAAGLTAGFAAYKVRNVGTVNGSDPVTPARRVV